VQIGRGGVRVKGEDSRVGRRVSRRSGLGLSTDGFPAGESFRQAVAAASQSHMHFPVARLHSRKRPSQRLHSRSGFPVAPSHAHGFTVAGGFAVARLRRRVHVWLTGERRERNGWTDRTGSGTAQQMGNCGSGTSNHEAAHPACRHSEGDGRRRCGGLRWHPCDQ
jgi:hypothetical protein